MLVTDDFIMLNFPKTGSSFAREAIRRAYGYSNSRLSRALIKLGFVTPKIEELMFPKIDEIYHSDIVDQHGTWRQIPPELQNRPVLSISRDPLSRYLSAYRYGWWRKYPPGDAVELQARYPEFPEISFEEFLDMSNHFGLRNRLGGIVPRIQLGQHTVQFIQFYFREPEKVLSTIDEEYISREKYRDDMADVTFLEQDNLRHDLKSFLLGVGKPASELAFLDEMEEINTSTGSESIQWREKAVTDTAAVQDIFMRDRLIYSIFPHYRPD